LVNNILPLSELSKNRRPVYDSLLLDTAPALENNKYILKIVEFENEYSEFENFTLTRIVYPKEFNLAVYDNKSFFYKDIITPVKIEKEINHQSVILSKKAFSGKAGSKLLLSFDQKAADCNALIWKASLRAGHARISKVAKSLLTIKNSKITDNETSLNKIVAKVGAMAMGNIASSMTPNDLFAVKYTIFMYIKGLTGQKEIHITHPRENPAVGILNLKPYLNLKKQKMPQLSLKWTNTHKLYSFGLTQIFSSTDIPGIKKEIFKPQNFKIKRLRPGEVLNLMFAAKEEKIKSDQKVSFIFGSKGYYERI